MNKLGAQCQMNTGALLNYCRIVHPIAAMGINVREPSFYRDLHAIGTKAIYRHVPNFDWDTSPERQAIEATLELAKITAGFKADLSWVLDNNEYIYSFDHARHDLADRYASAFVGEVHSRLGIHAVVLNLNTGHFRDDVLVFYRTLEAINSCGQCRLGWHEYDWPDMFRMYDDGLAAGNDGCWQTLRWKVAARAIHDAGYNNVRFAITECGIDGGVIPGQGNWGWRAVHQDYLEALWNYLRSLGRYMDAIERDDDVDFALLFGCGMNPDWVKNGFEINEDIARFIAGHQIYPPYLGGKAWTLK